MPQWLQCSLFRGCWLQRSRSVLDTYTPKIWQDRVQVENWQSFSNLLVIVFNEYEAFCLWFLHCDAPCVFAGALWTRVEKTSTLSSTSCSKIAEFPPWTVLYNCHVSWLYIQTFQLLTITSEMIKYTLYKRIKLTCEWCIWIRNECCMNTVGWDRLHRL